MNTIALTAAVHEERGVYVAYCPEVGTVSQGRTADEAVANLREATELYLEDEDPEEIARLSATELRRFEAEVALDCHFCQASRSSLCWSG